MISIPRQIGQMVDQFLEGQTEEEQAHIKTAIAFNKHFDSMYLLEKITVFNCHYPNVSSVIMTGMTSGIRDDISPELSKSVGLFKHVFRNHHLSLSVYLELIFQVISLPGC